MDQTYVSRRAAGFAQVREAHRTEITEDYVELISDLIAETGEARLTDLAELMGVTHPTVSKVVQRLQKEGLVATRPYRSIFLTCEGEAIAAASRARHRIVFEFLRAIGISESVAERDSEGLEHHCSPETLAIFERIIVERNSG